VQKNVRRHEYACYICVAVREGATYVYIFVEVHVCVYMYMYTYIRTHMYTCIFMHIHMQVPHAAGLRVSLDARCDTKRDRDRLTLYTDALLQTEVAVLHGPCGASHWAPPPDFNRSHSATHCNTLPRTSTHCNTLQHTATHCHTMQHAATRCNTLQHTATHCHTLPHNTTCCNTLQHTATHCSQL